jgi:hypothetical protein
MEWAIAIGSLHNLCPEFFTVVDDFEAHGAMHVLDVVEVVIGWLDARGSQPPPLVVLAGVRVLLSPSPLSYRFAFDLQNQLTVFVDELNNFIHWYCHDYLLLARDHYS